MTTLYFVRHAEPNYDNHDDLTRELTAKGLADRMLVAKLLADVRVDAVVSSPYHRAIDTVKPLAEARGLPVEIMDDLRERKIDSCWIEDFNAFARRQWADFTYKLSDGECLAEVQARNLAAVQAILAAHAGQTVAIGSHGTAQSTIIHHFVPGFGYDEFEAIRRVMPWVVRFVFDEGGQCLSIRAFDVFSETSRWLLAPTDMRA